MSCDDASVILVHIGTNDKRTRLEVVSFCFGSYPPPGTCRKTALVLERLVDRCRLAVHNGLRRAAERRNDLTRNVALRTYHSIGGRAVHVCSCAVQSNRLGADGIVANHARRGRRRTYDVILIAALRGWAIRRSRKDVINQAGAGCVAERGSTVWSQRCKRRREAEARIAGGIADLSRVKCTDRACCRGICCRHSRPQQVRDRDGGNDQNDRDHDQKFDERKALLFAHCGKSPLETQ